MQFFREALRSNLSPAYVRDDLVALGMKDEYAEVVAAKWKANFLRLSRSVLGHTLTVNEITDMRWRFGGLFLPCTLFLSHLPFRSP